jgi:hypothetical protein
VCRADYSPCWGEAASGEEELLLLEQIQLPAGRDETKSVAQSHSVLLLRRETLRQGRTCPKQRLLSKERKLLGCVG